MLGMACCEWNGQQTLQFLVPYGWIRRRREPLTDGSLYCGIIPELSGSDMNEIKWVDLNYSDTPLSADLVSWPRFRDFAERNLNDSLTDQSLHTIETQEGSIRITARLRRGPKVPNPYGYAPPAYTLHISVTESEGQQSPETGYVTV